VLRFGSSAHVLSTIPSKNVRQEIYASNPDRVFSDWHFSHLVSHNLTLAQANNTMDEMQSALEVLKNSMATIQKETEARKYVLAQLRDHR
jgi:hypothetical protein